jgi:hypothetical protein
VTVTTQNFGPIGISLSLDVVDDTLALGYRLCTWNVLDDNRRADVQQLPRELEVLYWE